jgi:hypothetical protein
MAHLPSAKFTANAACLVLAAIAFNLTRAARCLASTFHARATGATIRRHLINVPARLARSARRLTLHLPTDWPWARTGSACSTHCTPHHKLPETTIPADQARPEHTVKMPDRPAVASRPPKTPTKQRSTGCTQTITATQAVAPG